MLILLYYISPVKIFWCVKYYKAQPYNMEHTLCVCVKQKQYFLERINHSKIGTAIFGTKTIDDWYNALVSQFFEHEE